MKILFVLCNILLIFTLFSSFIMQKTGTTSNFIKKAKSVHGEKYDYSKSDFIGSAYKISIVCSKHGIFIQGAAQHLFGNGCPKCAGFNRTTKDFIKDAKVAHGSRYNYSNVYYNGFNNKVEITCKVHGVFLQTPKLHLDGCGCAKCATKVRSTEQFIKEAIETYGNKYDYSLVKYVNARTKINIICKVHGKFQQVPHSHLSGMNCSLCVNNKRKTTKSFIKDAKKIHRNRYDYSLVDYKNIDTNVKLICKKHNSEFEQNPYTVLNSNFNGCPQCRVNSKGEKLIQNYLNNSQIKYEFQKRFPDSEIPRIVFDFYLPKLNLLIEYNGIQHYEPVRYFGGKDQFVKQKSTDNKKKLFAFNNGYALLEIPYYINNPIKTIKQKITELTINN